MLVSTFPNSFLRLRTPMKNCRFSSVRTKFEPGSAGPVRGSMHPLPAVRFWFAVQANALENRNPIQTTRFFL
jgi:hypothetical protein